MGKVAGPPGRGNSEAEKREKNAGRSWVPQRKQSGIQKLGHSEARGEGSKKRSPEKKKGGAYTP